MTLRRNYQRDMEIIRKVLEGEKQKAVATEYGVTPERVRQIVHKYCRGSNASGYERIRREKGGNIEHLQEGKDIFLP